MLRNSTLLLSLVLGFTAGASAQDRFNIDLGDPALGVPAATYGAAAAQAGTWNAIDGSIGAPIPLVDLSGAATTVTCMVAGPNAVNYSFPEPGTMGDDELLMDDCMDPTPTGTGPGLGCVVIIAGLPDGQYRFTTYGMPPCGVATYQTEIDIPLSSDPPQICMGAWPGSFVAGMTHVVHNGIVVTGGVPVEINYNQPSANWQSANGIQIEPDPGTTMNLGTEDPVCQPLPNSAGSAALIDLTGTGTAGGVVAGTVSMGPAAQFGYFISGPNPGLYIVPPGSSGIVCIGNPQYRYNNVPLGQVFQFDAGGVSQAVSGGGPSQLATDGSYAPVPAVMAGQSRAFQAWYRDVSPFNSNFTNSKIVLFN